MLRPSCIRQHRGRNRVGLLSCVVWTLTRRKSCVRIGFGSMKPLPQRLTGAEKTFGISTTTVANAENHIKEAKYGFAVDQFSCQNFGANQALQALKLLAYNLLLLYKQVALQPGVRQWTAGRLRRRLFCLPGLLVHHARQWTIRFPKFAQRLSAQMIQAVP